jgi:RES domain-containing protein
VKAYRIGNSRHPIWDGTGAALIGARWNSIGRGVIYAAETYSGALLEVLVRMALFAVPEDSQYVEIEIPGDLAIEKIEATPEQLARESFTKPSGDEWLRAMRTPVLMVPSVVTLVEHNLLINPRHPDFSRIEHSDPKPIWWDRRFFRQPD